jgi:4-hydroxy-tetrahydrodipicolinate synthase
MNDVTGIHVPTITPFTPQGGVDEAGIETLTQFWIERGVRCLVPTANNGEAPHLSPEERRLVWRRTVQAAAGRAAVFPSITTNTTAEAASFARTAEAIGAQGIMLAPPFYFRLADEELVRYYTEVADATGLPVMIHNEPWLFKMDVKAPLVDRLSRAGRGNIRLIKESTDDSQRVSEILTLCGDRMTVVVAGGGTALESLYLGATGWMTGLINFLPAICADVYRLAVTERKLDEARALYCRRVWPAHALMKAVGRPVPTVKYALELLGLPAGSTRPPLLPLTPEQQAQVRSLLGQIGLLPG